LGAGQGEMLMSMICYIQSFRKKDVDSMINNTQVADVSVSGKTDERIFPLSLMLMETIALIIILGGLTNYHPKYLYIWLTLGIILS
jgi:hypothetical protein